MLSETSRVPQVAFADGRPAMLRLALALLSRWHRRSRTRRQLARLDANALKDIGLTRLDQRVECEKPFWRG